MRIGHGYVWLSNGRRRKGLALPRTRKRISAAPHPWTRRCPARSISTVTARRTFWWRTLPTFIPGEPVKVPHEAAEPEQAGVKFTLKTTLNGKTAENAFAPERR